MKKSVILFLLFVLWIGSSITAVVFINKHIEDKDSRLRCDIRNKIEALFENQSSGSNFITFNDGFFDSPMHGAAVKNFTRASIPAKPKKSDFKNIEAISPGAYEEALADWEKSYGDVATLWDLNWGDSNYRNIDDEGWNIIGLRCFGTDEELIHTFVIFPYRVALKKTQWGNYYTVPEATAEAFEFFSSDPKSSISDRFEQGSHSRLWSKIYDCQNEYYGIYQNDKIHSWYHGTPIPGAASPQEGGPIEYTWMHNGYYRVYVAVSQVTYHGIIKHYWSPDIKERNTLLLWWLICIAIIFLLPIIYICVKIHKENKVKSETTKQKLLRLCSPKAFMEPYNKELVDKANSIYPKIVSCDLEEELISYADEAQTLLGISLVSAFELNEAKKLADPANFTKPYNAEKISKANEIFNILSQPVIKYSVYISAKNQIKELYN